MGGELFAPPRERELFTDNLLVRIQFIIVMIRWTGLAPWEFDREKLDGRAAFHPTYRGTSLIRKRTPLGPYYRRPTPSALW